MIIEGVFWVDHNKSQIDDNSSNLKLKWIGLFLYFPIEKMVHPKIKHPKKGWKFFSVTSNSRDSSKTRPEIVTF